MRKGLSYGWLSARRRIREMVLPVITTATGAILVVIVFGMSNGIRVQSASLGHAEEIGRAVVLIAVTVLLVVSSRSRWHPPAPSPTAPANSGCSAPTVCRARRGGALAGRPVIAAVLGALVGACLPLHRDRGRSRFGGDGVSVQG
jgi:hypothetical protein